MVGKSKTRKSKAKCPECGSKAWASGYDVSRKYGKRQRYKCSECARVFCGGKLRKKVGGRGG